MHLTNPFGQPVRFAAHALVASHNFAASRNTAASHCHRHLAVLAASHGSLAYLLLAMPLSKQHRTSYSRPSTLYAKLKTNMQIQNIKISSNSTAAGWTGASEFGGCRMGPTATSGREGEFLFSLDCWAPLPDLMIIAGSRI